MKENFKIEIKTEILELLGNRAVCLKKDTFFIGELNYYTAMKILKVVNQEYYKGLLEHKDFCQASINNIINENKNNSPKQILDIILKSDVEILETLGKNTIENFNEVLRSNNFYIDKFKAIVYSDEPVDYKYIFNQFDNIKVLFIYNPTTNRVDIITNKGTYIPKYRNKHIKSEKELDLLFKNFNKNKIKVEENNYLNELIRKIINNFFNLEIFFEEFSQEIINRLGQLLMVVDIDEETKRLLEEKLNDLPFNEKVAELISRKMNGKTKEITQKYGMTL